MKVSYPIKGKLFSFFILGAFALFSGSSLFADTLRVNAEYWPGDATPELQDRFFVDHLLSGMGFSGQIDMPWSGTMTNTTPVGIQYFKEMGPGRLVVSGKYYRYMPDYAFTSIYTAPAIGNVKLDNYAETNIDGDLGYEIKAATGSVLITPKAGLRSHSKSFDYDQTVFGAGTYVLTLNGPFSAHARALYLGADLQVKLNNQFSLIGEFVMNSPLLGDWGGDMTFDQTQVGIVGSSLGYLYINKANSSYKIDMQRVMLGIQYDATPTLHLKMGVRQEVTTASYPDYWALPFLVVGGNLNASYTVEELALNNLFVYRMNETTTKGMLFFGISADLNM